MKYSAPYEGGRVSVGEGKVNCVWVMLPAFNEAKALPQLVPKVVASLRGVASDFRVIVVNDGSTDDTVTAIDKLRAAGYPVEVVTHWINRGLGETERDGFEFVAQNGSDADVLIRMDCDDTHDPSYISQLLAAVTAGADVVSTSRFRTGGGQVGVSAYRAFISYCANAFMALVFRVPGIRDYSCGFRAYRVSAIRDAVAVFGNSFLQLRGLGFTSTLETIVKLQLLGCSFAEVPFVLRYDRKRSASKMVTSITAFGYIAMAVLHNWPFGGWRMQYRGLAGGRKRNRTDAVSRFARHRKLVRLSGEVEG
jgi:dolichol-phosphate mannosyltransferase